MPNGIRALLISGAYHVTQRASPADEMERLAGELHMLAFDMREPSRSICRSERLIDEAERIAGQLRAVVRGTASRLGPSGHL